MPEGAGPVNAYRLVCGDAVRKCPFTLFFAARDVSASAMLGQD